MNCKYFKGRFKKEEFGFAQVGIQVPDKLYDKFSDMGQLFVAQKIPDCNILETMKMYKKNSRKTIRGTKKLLGVKKGKKILL